MISSAGLGHAKKSGAMVWRAAAFVVPAVAAVLVLCLALTSAADAKKRRTVRHVYAPPQSSMVLDANTGKILHANNIDELRFPASITKVMTLYLVFEQIKAGRLAHDTELKVSAFAAGQAPSKLDLAPGSSITVHDAMYALVTKSANDAAVVIAENLAGSEAEFARFMTKKARALGMTNTTFRNASGLPDTEQRTSARDLVILAQRILRDFPEQAAIFRTRVFTYEGESHRNHNGLLFTYPGCEGLKTGYTQASGFNLLASVKRGDKHLLAVVLGGASARDRNARMRTLLNAAWDGASDEKGRAPVVASAAKKPELASGPAAAPAPAKAAPAAPKQQVAAVTEIAPEDMPEPNPAFHPTTAERTLVQTLNTMRKAAQEPREAQREAAPASAPAQPLAMASMAPAPKPAVSAPATPAAVTPPAPAENGFAATEVPATDSPSALGPYHVQVGSYLNVGAAKSQLQAVTAKASDLLKGHGELTVAGNVNGKAYYRARFGRFSENEAKDACAKLKAMSFQCMVFRAE